MHIYCRYMAYTYLLIQFLFMSKSIPACIKYKAYSLFVFYMHELIPTSKKQTAFVRTHIQTTNSQQVTEIHLIQSLGGLLTPSTKYNFYKLWNFHV